jgi:hypothetical protein
MNDEVTIFEGWSDAETYDKPSTASLGKALSKFKLEVFANCLAQRLIFICDVGMYDDNVSIFKKYQTLLKQLAAVKEVQVVDISNNGKNDKDLNCMGLNRFYDTPKTIITL